MLAYRRGERREVGDSSAQLAFYAIVAQIIPVLFLALAFETRALQLEGRDEPDRRAAAVTALALILAGYESLQVLVSGDAAGGSLRLVAGALAAATVGLALPALTRPVRFDQPAGTTCPDDASASEGEQQP